MMLSIGRKLLEGDLNKQGFWKERKDGRPKPGSQLQV